ncbi:unnamed protein product, partial [marine sediment metagenome]
MLAHEELVAKGLGIVMNSRREETKRMGNGALTEWDVSETIGKE